MNSSVKLTTLTLPLKRNTVIVCIRVCSSRRYRYVLTWYGVAPDIIGEDDFVLLTRGKELKRQYREHFENYKKLKSDIDHCGRLVDQCRQRLMTDFESWFETMYGNVVVDDSTIVTAAGGNASANVDIMDQEVCW